jgi:hypothetical protein
MKAIAILTLQIVALSLVIMPALFASLILPDKTIDNIVTFLIK